MEQIGSIFLPHMFQLQGSDAIAERIRYTGAELMFVLNAQRCFFPSESPTRQKFMTTTRASQIFLRFLLAGFIASVCVSRTLAQSGVIRVSAYGAMPNDGMDDVRGIAAAIAALQAGDTLLFDNGGIYELHCKTDPAGASQGPPLFKLENKPNITITCVQGVRLEIPTFDRSLAGGRMRNIFEIYNCDNFSVLGASPTDPLVITTRGTTRPVPSKMGHAFLQGAVTQTATSGVGTVRMQVNDPDLFLPPNCFPTVWAWVSDDEQAGQRAMYEGKVRAVAPPSGGVQTVEFTFSTGGRYQQWRLGEEVVAILNKTDFYAFTVYHGNGRTVFRDIVAEHLPGKFIQAGNLENVAVERVHARPAINTRRLSVARDGINVEAASVLIQDCEVIYPGDDAIVSNATALCHVVPNSQSNNSFDVRSASPLNQWPSRPKPGAWIVIVPRNNPSFNAWEYAQISSATLVAIPRKPYSAIYRYTWQAATPNFKAALAAANNPNQTTQYLVFNAQSSILGCAILNCNVVGPRGVGIQLRGGFNNVQTCRIHGASIAGVHAGGGLIDRYPWYGTGTPMLGLTIDGCSIDHCGNVDETMPITGAIEIAWADGEVPPWQTGCPYGYDPVYPASMQLQDNILITNNFIGYSSRAGLFAANVGGPGGGIQVLNNTFMKNGLSNLNCYPSTNSHISIHNSANGLVSNNTFSDDRVPLKDDTGNIVFIP